MCVGPRRRRSTPAPSRCPDIADIHRPRSDPGPSSFLRHVPGSLAGHDRARSGTMIDQKPSGLDRLDHRELNRDLRVFATDPLVGSGLPLWLPAGAAIRDELQRLAKDVAHDDGCVDVYTPVLGKRELFERSGHWAKFSADMFPPMKLGEDEVVLRPANCPHHALAYASTQHSYRELAIRLNELAPMFRAERSGVVSGLQRVRQINLDDTPRLLPPGSG